MKKILYLHGLDSFPTEEKLNILKKFCDELTAPLIDYRRPDLQSFLLETAQNCGANILIGSSMGGLSAYILAKYLGCKALLFNTAFIKMNNYAFALPTQINENYTYKVVLGALDDVIDHQKSIDFLANNEKNNTYQYIILPKLAHRIDVETFENEIHNFINEI